MVCPSPESLRELRQRFCRRRWALAAALLTGLAGIALAADAFLDPEVAFPLAVRSVDPMHLELRFDVAPGYHLYRERFGVTAEPVEIALGELPLPQGQPDFDLTTQKQVQVFRSAITVALPLRQAPIAAFKLLVVNQGCADKGLCYLPMERAFRVAPGPAGWGVTALSDEQAAAWQPDSAQRVAASAIVVKTAALAPAPAVSDATAAGGFSGALQSHSLLAVAGAFLLAGLLLSLTPCVLPMIPILSSIIVGQGGPVSRARGFLLALAYALGMAVVYTAFGMAAGLMGEGLAAALQNAWVLGAFALLLATLSMSMFGVYEFQLPSSLQSRLTLLSGRLQGGQYLGVWLMGGLSALIVGPCVAAPLAGALVYISQTRDVLLGGVALFSLACGMSVPLLLLGLSAGALLPRAGGWMERVKHFFGVLLLAVALWMVSPVLPSWALMGAAALLLLASAVYLGAFERLDKITPGRALTKAGGLALAALAGLQLVGAVSGGQSLAQPLQHLAGGFNSKAGTDELHFERVADLNGLQQAVRASSQPVLLDFYADWCVACKEFESLTLSDPAVRRQLSGYKLLRADVTANSAADKALLRQYSLFGPPALLFMKPDGREVESHRVIGFQDAASFARHLSSLALRLGPSGVSAGL
jgi:thiol:disulfide interchange protein DsbD